MNTFDVIIQTSLALILCGKPSRPVLPFDKSALTSRLTDVSRLVKLYKTTFMYFNPFCRYGGTHRNRFDSKGHGLGVAGRRDIRNIIVGSKLQNLNAMAFLATNI